MEDSLMSGQNGDLNTVLSSNQSNQQQNQQQQQQQQQNNSNNERPAGVSYTMPGILHYLQHESNRYELDRQQWEVEKAELMTKISFLQGERRGQENLKNNLIRRIKMLELALKQERVKFHKLKFGVEPLNDLNKQSNSSNTQSLTSNDNDLNEMDSSTFSIGQHPILNKENTTVSTTKQGRQILKQYLQEIGYTDTIIDIRSSRLRTLLGLKSLNNQTNTGQSITNHQLDLLTATNLLNNNESIANLLNDNSSLSKRINLINSSNSLTNGQYSNNQINGDVQKILQMTESDAQSMLMMNNLDFITTTTNSTNSTQLNNINSNNQTNEEDDEEMNDEEQSTSRQKMIRNQQNGDTFNALKTNQQQQDLEEDAMKEFSFLTNESASTDDSSDWSVNKAQLIKLTEEYKKEKKSTKSAKQQQNQTAVANNNTQRPNRAALQAMIANLNENDSSQQQQQQEKQNENSNTADFDSSSSSTNQQQSQISFSNSAKLFLEEDGFNTESNLGELSRISVNNSNLNLSGINDETIIDSSSRKTISNKFSLRGHFDAVRCMTFHPNESALVTGSEDQTIKLWNLDKSSLSNKKNNINADLEPCYTFRKHTGSVLSVVLSTNGDHLISSGLDSKIIVWNMPNYETVDQFDAYSPSVFQKYLNGHTDAVWGLVLVDNTLVSISSDSTIRLWNPFSIDELDEASSSCIKCLNENKEEGIPTSVDFINNDKSKIVTSFESSHHNVYDLETSKVICRLDYYDPTINSHCYKVLSHPATSNLNSSLVISGHDDKKIRFFDINSGKLVYHMVAHQDACTNLAIDPTCFYLLSSSHDCSLRLWDIETKSCIQELTAHRKKYDESIHCIAFHPTKPFIASGGADAIVKIYV